MSLSPADLIAFLNGMPPEALLLFQALFCFGTILVMVRLFGAAGLYLYIATAVIAANVEVLKAVQFSFYDHPVAMGTVLFGSTYLATDILTEHYGRQAARRAIFLSFAAYLLFTLLMVLTLGFRPMNAEQAAGGMEWALPMHDHIGALFSPAPALFAAGMTAYLTSQLFDVWVYQRIRGVTGDRHLWLRNNASTMLSSLVDNVIFSVLAWVVFSPDPVGWEALFYTYILGTYGMRVALTVLDTPFMYLSRRMVRRVDG
ncbi:queuosine precursor transporter [Niveispirillum fermenti]|uniref:queuosine precursor transporter n=1 Tax=Niveispirillum fermenti TaxID=1233113 RepID=UPI003A839D84